VVGILLNVASVGVPFLWGGRGMGHCDGELLGADASGRTKGFDGGAAEVMARRRQRRGNKSEGACGLYAGSW
jgi:hypothetical protein